MAFWMAELIQGSSVWSYSEECKARLEDLGQIPHSAMLKSLCAAFHLITFWRIVPQFSWNLPQRKYLNNTCVGSVLKGVYEFWKNNHIIWLITRLILIFLFPSAGHVTEIDCHTLWFNSSTWQYFRNSKYTHIGQKLLPERLQAQDTLGNAIVKFPYLKQY